MVAIASGLDSVYVRVISAPRTAEPPIRRSAPSDDDTRRVPYLALVYSQLPLAVTRVADPPPGQPTSWGGDTLLGVEPFHVHWGRYSRYLASYLEGEQAAHTMERSLFDALSPNLSAILTGQFGGARPTRTWFHSEAPELSELPWELVAYADGHRASAGDSFVRGAPPEAATPLVPVVGRLRLGVIDPKGLASRALSGALLDLGAGIEVVRLGGGLRDGLRQAAADGLELLHVVADGAVTSSYDGVIATPGTREPPVAASELVTLLRGCRVRLLGLTPPSEDPAMISQSGFAMPVAHRAFTYLGTSPHPLPSVVAPLGPMRDDEVYEFWSPFYRTLGEQLAIEAAMADAQRHRLAAMALFLRQLQPATFRLVTEQEQPSTDPSIVTADLASSRELLDQFEVMKANLGIATPSLDVHVERERARQVRLEGEVAPWIEGVEER